MEIDAETPKTDAGRIDEEKNRRDRDRRKVRNRSGSKMAVGVRNVRKRQNEIRGNE